MTLHIGIVACSAEGAALCYRTICVEGAAQLGPHAHPEVSMHTHSLAEYMDRIYRGDWPGVAELMLSSADKLARIGADFLICPDNTIHQALRPRRPAFAPALAAHRRGGRRRSRAARLPARRHHRHALARRQRGLSRKAARARTRGGAAERRRARRDQPDHHGRAGAAACSSPESVAYFQQVIGRLKDERLRRGGRWAAPRSR